MLTYAVWLGYQVIEFLKSAKLLTGKVLLRIHICIVSLNLGGVSKHSSNLVVD
jgi:hypothetical protein